MLLVLADITLVYLRVTKLVVLNENGTLKTKLCNQYFSSFGVWSSKIQQITITFIFKPITI